MDFNIEELDVDNSETIDRFREFYDNIFTKCFPKDEIGEFEDYLSIKKKENAEYTYHLSFAEVDGKYIACYIYCVFPKIQMMVGEFACVDTEYRRSGIASKLMHSATKQHRCKWLFGEIEKDNEFNLKTWKKYGFKKIPVNYVQLPLSKERNSVDNLFLCVLPVDGQTSILAEDVKKFVYHYYRWSQYYGDPSKLKEYIQLCSELSAYDSLDFQEL